MVAEAPPPIVSFAPLPAGWHSFTGDNGVSILDWRYRPSSSGWAPSMPEGGIAVSVFFPPALRLHQPLRLVLPETPAAVLEGAADTPEYRLHGEVAGRGVEVWVDIRDPHPGKKLLARARRIVASIRFG